ncbi:MAG TPA: hypothetical protein VHW23_05595 [Kofleriaceae bacterium]|nr:hypothetical protein [Kofleriaceae bacterium]
MLVLAALVMVNLYVFVWDKQTSIGAIKREADRATPTATVPSHPLAAPVAGAGSAAPSAPAPVGARGAVERSETAGGGHDGAAGGAGGRSPRGIEAKVGRSDTLGRVLKKSGLSAAEADEVIRALSGVFDFKTMRPGQTYRIERGPDGRVASFELVVGKAQTVRADRGSDGALVGKPAGAPARSEGSGRP